MAPAPEQEGRAGPAPRCRERTPNFGKTSDYSRSQRSSLSSKHPRPPEQARPRQRVRTPVWHATATSQGPGGWDGRRTASLNEPLPPRISNSERTPQARPGCPHTRPGLGAARGDGERRLARRVAASGRYVPKAHTSHKTDTKSRADGEQGPGDTQRQARASWAWCGGRTRRPRPRKRELHVGDGEARNEARGPPERGAGVSGPRPGCTWQRRRRPNQRWGGGWEEDAPGYSASAPEPSVYPCPDTETGITLSVRVPEPGGASAGHRASRPRLSATRTEQVIRS